MAATENTDAFVFYPTFLTSIEAIKNTEMRLAMFEAVANYGVYGVLPDFTETDPNGLLDGMFSQIRFSIDAAKAKRDYTNEVQRLKQLLRWKKITRSEYVNHIKCLSDKYNINTTVYNGIQRNTYNVNINVNENVDVNENDIEKEKDKKESNSLSLSPEEVEFYAWMNQYLPTVQRLEEPLTMEQYRKACNEYGKKAVNDKLTDMENRKDLLEKNRSAYKTVIKWIQRDEQK